MLSMSQRGKAFSAIGAIAPTNIGALLLVLPTTATPLVVEIKKLIINNNNATQQSFLVSFHNGAYSSGGATTPTNLKTYAGVSTPECVMWGLDVASVSPAKTILAVKIPPYDSVQIDLPDGITFMDNDDGVMIHGAAGVIVAGTFFFTERPISV